MKITVEFSSCNERNNNRDCDWDCDAMIAVMAYAINNAYRKIIEPTPN